MTVTQETQSLLQPQCASASENWIEVLAPVELAAPLIADALQREPVLPIGMIIARTSYGSIVLNQRAWTMLHPMLKAIEGLQTRHSSLPPPPAVADSAASQPAQEELVP